MTHWVTHYDEIDDEPFGEVCECVIGVDHNDDGEKDSMSEWKRSSFCGNSTCVEVRLSRIGGRVLKTSHVESNKVFIANDEWDAFIAGVKAGEFDD